MRERFHFLTSSAQLTIFLYFVCLLCLTLQLLCFYTPCSVEQGVLQLCFEGEGVGETEHHPGISPRCEHCHDLVLNALILRMVMSATPFCLQGLPLHMPYLPLKPSVKDTLTPTELALGNALSHSMLALESRKHLFQLCLSASSKILIFSFNFKCLVFRDVYNEALISRII